MIAPDLLALLRCAESGQELAPATAAQLEQVNQAIRAGRAQTRGGQAVREPLTGGLVRADGRLLYPIRDGLPILLVDEAIPLAAG